MMYTPFIYFIFLLSIISIRINGLQRENLAVRHPCYSINKRLEPYITWTERLASSQYKGPKDGCVQRTSGPVCCTYDILDSYAKSLEIELKLLVDAELNRLSHVLLSSKQQIEDWFQDYTTESHRLTISSLETLYGTNEYRSNVHHAVSTLFETLADRRSSTDDVSKSTIELFNHLIISSYRRFMSSDPHLTLDERFQRCLVTKAFDIEALPSQRQLLYTLTSISSSLQILRSMLVYLDADLQRLKSMGTWTVNQCTQRYARETLCPICLSQVSSSIDSNKPNESINQSLCPNSCRYVLRSCFNQTNNPYVAFASMAKGYATIIKEIEKSVIDLKLVERLSKFHIHLYDMVVNVTNTRHIYTQLQTACPHDEAKGFNPIRSLPPIINERRELVQAWNRSLHFIFHQLKSSIDNLHLRLSQQIMTDICSNINYAVKSSRCTQIDQQKPSNLIQWSIPSDRPSSVHLDSELTRNQLDDLKKKMAFIEQMILSLQPKKKYVLMEYIPDFESYDNDFDIHDSHENQRQLSASIDIEENEHQGSLSEQLYKEIDQQTTRRRILSTTRKSLYVKQFNHSSSIQWNLFLILVMIITLINR